MEKTVELRGELTKAANEEEEEEKFLFTSLKVDTCQECTATEKKEVVERSF